MRAVHTSQILLLEETFKVLTCMSWATIGYNCSKAANVKLLLPVAGHVKIAQ